MQENCAGRGGKMIKTRVGLELRSLNNMIRRFFEFSSHKKEIETVTGNNGWIIGFLADNADREIFQRDIEDHFTITRSTASKVLSLMEQKGLIRRMAVSQDARLKKIVLTDKAHDITKIMLDDREKLENTLMKGFTEDEAELLVNYLTRMKENISNQVKN